MENKEKEIFLSHFKAKVEDGPVKFLVLDAKYDEITTKNGKKEIVKLEVELEELNNPDSNKVVQSVNLFVDYNPRGRFYNFVNAAVTAMETNSFQPSKLIGSKGTASLSHYTPKGSELSFAQLNDWVFYKSNVKVAKALANYLDDDDMDFDYEGDDEEIV